MSAYNFDKIISREGTDSVKYDLRETLYKRGDIIPLWVADMDFEVPDFIVNAVKERADHPVYGYTFRPRRFWESVAGWLHRRHGWEVDPSHINFSPGVVPALNLAVLEFTEPGEKVLVQPPVYFPFFSAVENHGRKLVFNQLREENGRYTMDFDDLEEKFREGVKMMLFCHPHNPVGRAWTGEELERLAALAVQYNVLVLSDEIHSDLLLFQNRHIPLASIGPEISGKTITTIAPSKTFNLAGLHSSAVIIEDKQLRKRYDRMLEDLHIGGGNLFGMVAMETAYNLGEEWLIQLLEYLGENYIALKSYLSQHLPDVGVSPLEATYLAWLDFRKLGISDEKLSDLLVKEAGLGLSDGPRFGSGGSGFQRINIASPRKVLLEALDQLSFAINR